MYVELKDINKPLGTIKLQIMFPSGLRKEN